MFSGDNRSLQHLIRKCKVTIFLLVSDKKSKVSKKIGLIPFAGVCHFWLFWSLETKKITMGKSNHFFGQPLYGQLIKLIDKEKVLDLSRSKGGERYIAML